MYEQVFNLSERPFTTTPFVEHYYPAYAIDQSLAQAKLAISRATGPVVVVGPTGTGKTLLLELLAKHFSDTFKTVSLGCARLAQRSDLLQGILFELNQPYRSMSEGELRLSLIDYLKPSPQCPNGILLLVDEAHSLPPELLDEVRLITNMVRDGQPRVRLAMAGTQQLEHHLTDPKLDSFNQRITTRCYLEPLNKEETANYVRAHIDRAGGDGAAMFADNSVAKIHEYTDGLPRLINQLCDHAMILAASVGATNVDAQFIQEAWMDVQNIPGVVEQNVAQESVEQNGDWTVLEFGELQDEPQVASNEFETQSESVIETDWVSDEPQLTNESSVEETSAIEPVQYSSFDSEETNPVAETESEHAAEAISEPMIVEDPVSSHDVAGDYEIDQSLEYKLSQIVASVKAGSHEDVMSDVQVDSPVDPTPGTNQPVFENKSAESENTPMEAAENSFEISETIASQQSTDAKLYEDAIASIGANIESQSGGEASTVDDVSETQQPNVPTAEAPIEVFSDGIAIHGNFDTTHIEIKSDEAFELGGNENPIGAVSTDQNDADVDSSNDLTSNDQIESPTLDHAVPSSTIDPSIAAGIAAGIAAFDAEAGFGSVDTELNLSDQTNVDAGDFEVIEDSFEQLTSTIDKIDESFDTAEELAVTNEQLDELSVSDALQGDQTESLMPEANDPFAETFQQEESIQDSYSPIVSEQNRNSLSLALDDLALIQPVDEPGVETPIASPSTLQGSPVAEHTAVQVEDVSTPPDDIQLTEPGLNLGAMGIEEIAIGEEPLPELDEQEMAEVRRQAAEMFQAANQSPNTDNAGPSAIEYAQDQARQELSGTQEPISNLLAFQDLTESPGSHFIDSDAQQQAMSSSEQLLSEIKQQQQMLHDQVASSDLATPPVSNFCPDALETVDYQETYKIEQPLTDVTPEQLDGHLPTDDKDMLFVSRQSEMPSETTEPAPDVFPQMPSTGRAERMDYQELFNQLRKTGDEV